MKFKKQSLADFLKEHQSVFVEVGCVVKVDWYRETADIKYPDGFLVELNKSDFPNRNLIPVYKKTDNRKVVIDHYEQGHDAIPSPSLQRFLESGKTRYIPHETCPVQFPATLNLA